MKEKTTNFMQRYEKAFQLHETSKNTIDGTFYLKNGLLVFILGYFAFFLIGLFTNLLESTSYVFYGINVAVFLTLAVFIYSKNLRIQSGVKTTYSIREITLLEILYYGQYLVLILIAFTIFTYQSFSPIELVILQVLYTGYMIGSYILIERLYNLFYILYPIVIGCALFAITISLSPLVQYTIVVCVTSVIIILKEAMGYVNVKWYAPFALTLIFLMIVTYQTRTNRRYARIYNEIPGITLKQFSPDTNELYKYTKIDNDFIYFQPSNRSNQKLYITDYHFEYLAEYDLIEETIVIKQGNTELFTGTFEEDLIPIYAFDTLELTKVRALRTIQEDVQNDTTYHQYEFSFRLDNGVYTILVNESGKLISSYHLNKDLFQTYGVETNLNTRVTPPSTDTYYTAFYHNLNTDQVFVGINYTLYEITSVEYDNFKLVSFFAGNTYLALITILSMTILPYKIESEEETSWE